MKKFYLFQKQGMTSFYFCGKIHHALPTDVIIYGEQPVTFEQCVSIGECLEFENEEECEDYAISEKQNMDDDDMYAQEAMREEEYSNY